MKSWNIMTPEHDMLASMGLLSPCEKFICEYYNKCKHAYMACEAFHHFVTTGRAVSPMTRWKGEGKKAYIDPSATLTGARYMRIFREEDVQYVRETPMPAPRLPSIADLLAPMQPPKGKVKFKNKRKPPTKKRPTTPPDTWPCREHGCTTPRYVQPSGKVLSRCMEHQTEYNRAYGAKNRRRK